jgi:putative glutamine amidotransferase
MKYNLLKLFTLTLVFSCLNSTAQNHSESLTESTILIFHPTIRNIQTIKFLTENGIFPVPDDFHMIGVYHKNAAYNYTLSSAFIFEQNYSNITLIEVSDSLNPDNIFKENQSTALFRTLFQQSSGAILFGGPDIPPVCYGENTNLLTEISDPNRHFLELSFIFSIMGGNQNDLFIPFMLERQDYAVLGICLGMQTINVATGGKLIQDIPTQNYDTFTAEDVLQLDPEKRHRNYFVHIENDPTLIYGNFHSLYYERGSLFDVFNSQHETTPFVWSSHHQCIENIGKNLMPIAYSKDKKIIEAITHSIYPNVLGVQFHPEIVSIFNDSIQLKLHSSQINLKSYSEMFPQENGSDFHYALWKHVSKMFFKP